MVENVVKLTKKKERKNGTIIIQLINENRLAEICNNKKHSAKRPRGNHSTDSSKAGTRHPHKFRITSNMIQILVFIGKIKRRRSIILTYLKKRRT